MRSGEAESFIEAVGGGTGLVCGQLHERAAPSPGFTDGPGEQGSAQAAVAVGRMDPDSLDLSPQGTTAGKTRKEGKLHRGHDVMARLRDYQQMRRVAVDGLEGGLIGGQVFGAANPVSPGTELVSGEQAHDLGDITGPGAPQGDTSRAQIKRFQDLHPPSLPTATVTLRPATSALGDQKLMACPVTARAASPTISARVGCACTFMPSSAVVPSTSLA